MLKFQKKKPKWCHVKCNTDQLTILCPVDLFYLNFTSYYEWHTQSLYSDVFRHWSFDNAFWSHTLFTSYHYIYLAVRFSRLWKITIKISIRFSADILPCIQTKASLVQFRRPPCHADFIICVNFETGGRVGDWRFPRRCQLIGCWKGTALYWILEAQRILICTAN